MNRIYEPHKSSLLDLDANILCLVMYLIPLIGGVLFSSFRFLVWLIPLLIYLFEKNSPLVKFHAAQCLVIQILVSIINGILWIFAALSAGASLLVGFNVFSFLGTLGVTGIITGIISIAVVVMEVVAMIKAYGWISYPLPIFGSIASLFVKE